ncbi:Cro/CI family transcriptional regulator [Chromobacterium haemolyticum]|uniref:Uncharacterized protein n=1 Tax=Chromobacterium haemolyticum TaxID=394935 RepID=A0A1W0CDN2_9NEIS|nr:hypothetical protein B0T45_21105 [Chromobacterium haemolyticum]
MKKALVVKHFGGASRTASALQITPAAVAQWPEVVPFSAIGRIAYLQPDAWTALVAAEAAQLAVVSVDGVADAAQIPCSDFEFPPWRPMTGRRALPADSGAKHLEANYG